MSLSQFCGLGCIALFVISGLLFVTFLAANARGAEADRAIRDEARLQERLREFIVVQLSLV
jgi:hypothetical protein